MSIPQYHIVGYEDGGYTRYQCLMCYEYFGLNWAEAKYCMHCGHLITPMWTWKDNYASCKTTMWQVAYGRERPTRTERVWELAIVRKHFDDTEFISKETCYSKQDVIDTVYIRRNDDDPEFTPIQRFIITYYVDKLARGTTIWPR